MSKGERKNNVKTGDVDNIDWAEVIVNLENPERFTDHDIKRALKKCGRQFNPNGPFRRAISNMRLILGDSCKVSYKSGDVAYSIPDVDKTLKNLGYKGTEKKQKRLIPVHTQEDIDKIKSELGKDKIEDLELSILTMATFCKYERYTLSVKTISAKLKELSWEKGFNLDSINKILGELTLGEIINDRTKGSCLLKSKEELLDLYQRLRDEYRKISAKEYKVLDDFIVSKEASDVKKSKIYTCDIRVCLRVLNLFQEQGKLELTRKFVLEELLKDGLQKSYTSQLRGITNSVLVEYGLGRVCDMTSCSRWGKTFKLDLVRDITSVIEELQGIVSESEEKKNIYENPYKNQVYQPSILAQALNTLAILMTYGGKVGKEIFKSEMTKLMSASYAMSSPSVTRRVLNELGARGELKFDSEAKELLYTGSMREAYEELKQTYKEKTGSDFKDPVISKVEEKKEEEKKPDLVEIFRSMAKEISLPTPSTYIREESDDTKWRKWLVISAMKEKVGVQQKNSEIISWIRRYRQEEISESELKKYLTEFNEDFGRGTITYVRGEYFNFDSKKLGEMSTRYNPRYLKEKVYLRMQVMSEKNLSANFPGLEFTLEDELDGWGIYEVILDRSYQAELSMKKVIKLTEVSGKIYTSDLPIISRIIKILKMEEAEERMRFHTLLGLENI